MAELKTKENDASVKDFINSVEDEGKRRDSLDILDMFVHATEEKPKMWGTAIVGFGKYHYKSERSKQEGDWPLVGFSPRKQAITLYIMCGADWNKDLLKDLGKYKMSSGSCIYIKKLDDVDRDKLKMLIRESYLHSKKKFS